MPAPDAVPEGNRDGSDLLPAHRNTSDLPIFLSEKASEYGTFSVGVIDGERHVALTDPPPKTAWSRHLLELPPDPELLTWDGRRIRTTLENGSWVWIAEGQSPHGDVIFARWPD